MESKTNAEIATLVTRCQSGDKAAFDALFEETVPWVTNLVLGIVPDPEVARECVQDIYLLVWQKIGFLREPIAFLAWLKRIAVHRSLRCAKKVKANRSRTAHSQALEEVAAGDSPESKVAGQISLIQALAQLSPRERAVLVVRELHGASYEELARLFTVPVGTIRSRLNSAKRKALEYLRAEESQCHE